MNTPLTPLHQIDVTTGREYRYSEVKSLVERIASSLHHHGVCRSDTLGVFSPNSVDYILVVLAFVRLGAKVALINALSTAGMLSHILHIILKKTPAK